MWYYEMIILWLQTRVTLMLSFHGKKVKFSCSPLEKAFKKQIKTIEDQGEKQIDALKDLKDQNKQLDNISDYNDDLLHSKERNI